MIRRFFRALALVTALLCTARLAQGGVTHGAASFILGVSCWLYVFLEKEP